MLTLQDIENLLINPYIMNLKDYKEKVYQIIGSAMTVHSVINWGILEPVYQEALSLELDMRGIPNQREKEIKIFYKDIELSKKYKVDMVVDDILIELKSVVKLRPIHRAQLCNYLRLTQSPIGLLINFGEPKLVGERWAYNKETNECFLVDKDMEPVFVDYTTLLDTHEDF